MKAICLRLVTIIFVSSCVHSPGFANPNSSELARAGEETSQTQERLRREATALLWRSQFGTKMNDFLMGNGERMEILNKAHALTDYVYSQGGRAITYLSAIQMLVEDLYATGVFTYEQNERLTLLLGHIHQRQADANSYPGAGIAYTAVIFAVA